MNGLRHMSQLVALEHDSEDLIISDHTPLSLDAPGWTGWLYRARRWQRAAEAPTLDECARRLGAAAQRKGVPNRQTCCTRGKAPAHKPVRG
jgi:hypothetical protein